jgi:lipoate-protein ligase A
MNMAVDVALMQRARTTGESVFRVYSWSSPTLSLGRNQRAAGLYDPAVLAARDVAVVRRPTGGRAILHWREITYSVTAPANGVPALHRTYAAINEVLLQALRRLGAAVEVAAGPNRERMPDALPCFARPSAGEIVLSGGGKVVGSAQYREDGALLQHGSILLEDDQSLLEELTRSGHASPRPGTLSTALAHPADPADVTASLLAAVRDMLDRDARPLAALEVTAEAEKSAELFRDPLWTWRR